MQIKIDTVEESFTITHNFGQIKVSYPEAHAMIRAILELKSKAPPPQKPWPRTRKEGKSTNKAARLQRSSTYGKKG